jgi:hypothetical protein
MQCCGSGSGSGLIRIILTDPDQNPGHIDPDPADPDRYQFQTNEKVKLNFFQKISLWCPKCPENYNIFYTNEKDKTM